MTLLETFGSPEAVYFARSREYDKVAELTEVQKKLLDDKDMKNANRILTECAENGWRIMTVGDADYPDRLKNIFDPPVVLYVRGYLPDIVETYADLFPHKIGAAGRKKFIPLDKEGEERLVRSATNSDENSRIHIKKEIDKEKSVEYIDIIVKKEDLSENELKVLSVMSKEPTHIDDIIKGSGLTAAGVLSVMTILEIKGMVKQHPGKNFTSHISIQ